MNYYFDESGNWDGAEEHRLIMGGMLLGDDKTEVLNRENLAQDLDLAAAEIGLDSLHAADLGPDDRARVYRIIHDALCRGGTALVRIFDPSITRSRTTRSPEEVYTDRATELLNILTCGDQDIRLFCDHRFYTAYPANVIDNLACPRPAYYQSTTRQFAMTDQAFGKVRSRIQNKLQGVKGKRRSCNVHAIESFLEKLLSASAQHALESYLWTELWLRIQSTEIARENFRAKLMRNRNETDNRLRVRTVPPQLYLEFVRKEANNPGVIAIDFLCNLVYRYGKRPPRSASDTIRGLYRQIRVEEVAR